MIEVDREFVRARKTINHAVTVCPCECAHAWITPAVTRANVYVYLAVETVVAISVCDCTYTHLYRVFLIRTAERSVRFQRYVCNIQQKRTRIIRILCGCCFFRVSISGNKFLSRGKSDFRVRMEIISISLSLSFSLWRTCSFAEIAFITMQLVCAYANIGNSYSNARSYVVWM